MFDNPTAESINNKQRKQQNTCRPLRSRFALQFKRLGEKQKKKSKGNLKMWKKKKTESAQTSIRDCSSSIVISEDWLAS